MSWQEDLIKTYDNYSQNQDDLLHPLAPMYHTILNAKYVIQIKQDGSFNGVIDEEIPVIAPVTPASIIRTINPSPHGLVDTVSHLSGLPAGPKQKKDKSWNENYKYSEKEAANAAEKYNEYIKQLNAWIKQLKDWKEESPVLTAICKYMNAKVDKQGNPIKEPKNNEGYPQIAFDLGLVPSNAPEDMLPTCNPEAMKKYVTFRVCDRAGNCLSYGDANEYDKWIKYIKYIDQSKGKSEKTCIVTGNSDAANPGSYPKLQSQAKLFSNNDICNDDAKIKYSDRFQNEADMCGIGATSLFKINEMLKWLLASDSYKIFNLGEYGTVSHSILIWSPNIEVFEKPIPEQKRKDDIDPIEWLYNRLDGKLGREINQSDTVSMMVLSQSTQARLAITYYRSGTINELSENIEKWRTCKKERYDRTQKQYITSTCSVGSILQALYGIPENGGQKSNSNDGVDDYDDAQTKFLFKFSRDKGNCKLRQKTRDDLVKLIFTGAPIPESMIKRVIIRYYGCMNGLSERQRNCYRETISAMTRRNYYEKEKEKERKELSMDIQELPPEVANDRSFVWGRLLAAYMIEENWILNKTGKTKKETTAEQYEQIFHREPITTYEKLRRGIRPYLMQADESDRFFFNKKISEILNTLKNEDIASNEPLNELWCMGYTMESTNHFKEIERVKKAKKEAAERKVEGTVAESKNESETDTANDNTDN